MFSKTLRTVHKLFGPSHSFPPFFPSTPSCPPSLHLLDVSGKEICLHALSSCGAGSRLRRGRNGAIRALLHPLPHTPARGAHHQLRHRTLRSLSGSRPASSDQAATQIARQEEEKGRTWDFSGQGDQSVSLCVAGCAAGCGFGVCGVLPAAVQNVLHCPSHQLFPLSHTHSSGCLTCFRTRQHGRGVATPTTAAGWCGYHSD